jgi:hypothetical protein
MPETRNGDHDGNISVAVPGRAPLDERLAPLACMEKNHEHDNAHV